MSGTISKEVRPMVEKALRAGWRSKRIRSGIMLYPPDRSAAPVAIHGSMASRGTPDNIRNKLRRGGLDV